MNINEILLFWLKNEGKKHILFSERCKMLNEVDIYDNDIALPYCKTINYHKLTKAN